MEDQLKSVAASYDRGIDFGRRGEDLYRQLPDHITKDPDYPLFEQMLAQETSGSGRTQVRDYLSPAPGMAFADLGCCLNLMFRGYDEWPSTYHGVDISSKTIELLHEYVGRTKFPVGSLFCGSIHETPYESDFFDIGACIGSLEYFEKDFVGKVMKEAHRIMKPGGRFVLDIPDTGHAAFRIMKMIEGHLGREDKFAMSPAEFDELLENRFTIDKKEMDGCMIQYFLRCNK